MKTVPIQDLKQHLSGLIAEAEAGEEILVTRHGRPVAVLRRADAQHVTRGPRFGKAKLQPLFSRPATRGRYLEVLDVDREG